MKPRTMSQRLKWEICNDSPVWLKPRRHVHFICGRGNGEPTEYLEDKRGRLRTWPTKEAAEKVLSRIHRTLTLAR